MVFDSIIDYLGIHTSIKRIFPGKMDFGIDQLGYSDGIFFIYLYLVAAYLKLYPSKFTKNLWLNGITLLIAIALMYLSIVTPINKAALHPNLYSLNSAMLQEYSVLTVVAITIFNMFANINLGRIKFINWIAASTFAVYF